MRHLLASLAKRSRLVAPRALALTAQPLSVRGAACTRRTVPLAVGRGQRALLTTGGRAESGSVFWGGARGFQRREYGLEWYPTKATLLEAGAGPVLVGSSYEYTDSRVGAVRQARKYAAFQSHWDYWDFINEHNKGGVLHNLHELFIVDSPRCLYFDIDGDASFQDIDDSIIGLLTLFVRWFFSGDRLGWPEGAPEPVVMSSGDPRKYSRHIVFPQIQFRDYEQQRELMSVLLSALPALEIELVGGEFVPILERVVDRAPYMQFQLFRGPYACKLGPGGLRPETCLEPEGFFRGDPLACFAGHVQPEYALAVPSLPELLAENEELRQFRARQEQRVAASGSWPINPQDEANLYDPAFQRPGGGVVDLAGLTDLEKYEVALQWLHPDRASQWWSWFRLCGVTYWMLERYGRSEATRTRIWRAHHAWSSSYSDFSEEENVEKVLASQGRRISGLSLLLRLVRFDNPNVEVRASNWHGRTPSEPNGGAGR